MAINRLLDSLDKFQHINISRDFQIAMTGISLRWSAQRLIDIVEESYPDLDKLKEPVQELQELCNTFSSKINMEVE